MTHAIHSNHWQSIGYRMTAHDGLPGPTLTLLFLGSITGSITDSSGINKDLCPLKGHQSGCLGVPLIPTNHHTQFTHRGLDGMETQITGGEVELLVIGRIIGDMHLPIDTCDATVFF